MAAERDPINSSDPQKFPDQGEIDMALKWIAPAESFRERNARLSNDRAILDVYIPTTPRPTSEQPNILRKALEAKRGESILAELAQPQKKVA